MAQVKAQSRPRTLQAAAKAEVVRDQESPGSSPGGATEKRWVTAVVARRFCVCRLRKWPGHGTCFDRNPWTGCGLRVRWARLTPVRVGYYRALCRGVCQSGTCEGEARPVPRTIVDAAQRPPAGRGPRGPDFGSAAAAVRPTGSLASSRALSWTLMSQINNPMKTRTSTTRHDVTPAA